LFRTREFGNEVSVFYPIDKKEYDKKKDREGIKPLWLINGKEMLDGMRNAG
jgi:hypothetical protein